MRFVIVAACLLSCSVGQAEVAPGTRPSIGLTAADLKDVLDKKKNDKAKPPIRAGAVITKLKKDGPAAKAGFLAKDIVTQVDGKTIADVDALKKWAADTSNGKTYKLTVYRLDKNKWARKTIPIRVDHIDLPKPDASKPEKQARYNAIIAQKLSDEKIEPPKKLPIVGDETTLVALKAKPQDYVDVPFYVTGGIKVDDYYNFGYLYAKKTHYSFRFYGFNAEGKRTETAHFYALRSMGDDVIKVLVKREEVSPDAAILIRFKATVSSKYTKTFDDANDVYEVLDWQFYDGKKSEWSPWHSEVVELPPDVPAEDELP